jgi:nitrogen regulatory protein P-II 1
MKRIEAILRTGKVSDVSAALKKVGYPGLMISEIEGHGKHKGIEEEVRGKAYKVELLTKARVEVVAKDGDVERIVSAIREAAQTGKIGDGKIFIHPVEDAIRIRTSERGDLALC